MTIQNLADRIKYISLNHVDINSFYVGNTWNQSNSKGDVYPCVWLEFPILVTYDTKGQKEYSFSLDILMLPNADDENDELSKISECESIADDLLMAFSKYMKNFGVNSSNGLTIKNLNADIACGIRVDIKVSTNRECDWDNDFREVMVKE